MFLFTIFLDRRDKIKYNSDVLHNMGQIPVAKREVAMCLIRRNFVCVVTFKLPASRNVPWDLKWQVELEKEVWPGPTAVNNGNLSIYACF